VSLGRYSMIVATMAAVPLAALWPLLGARQDGSFAAAALGCALASLNAMAAFALVAWSSGRSNTVFFRAVLGGTLGRMVLLLGAVAGAIVLLGLPKLPLVIALLSYYVAFLALELAVVHRRTGAQNEAAS
jgi:hypothetical protein